MSNNPSIYLSIYQNNYRTAISLLVCKTKYNKHVIRPCNVNHKTQTVNVNIGESLSFEREGGDNVG